MFAAYATRLLTMCFKELETTFLKFMGYAMECLRQSQNHSLCVYFAFLLLI
jgi:hypothetical protein